MEGSKCMVLDTDLHLVYHVTPFDHDLFINYPNFMNSFENLRDDHRRVAHAIGLSMDGLKELSYVMMMIIVIMVVRNSTQPTETEMTESVRQS